MTEFVDQVSNIVRRLTSTNQTKTAAAVVAEEIDAVYDAEIVRLREALEKMTDDYWEARRD